MANYADPKTKTASETDGAPGVTLTQTSKGSGATIAYGMEAIAARAASSSRSRSS